MFRYTQAGNQVGESFWNMLLAEHGLDQSGVSATFEADADDAQMFLAIQGKQSSTDSTSKSRAIERVITILTVTWQVGTYFAEVDGSKYVPRSVQIDLEAGVTNRVNCLTHKDISRCFNMTIRFGAVH